MRFDLEEIEALLRLFERSSLTEMVVEWGEIRLTFKRQPRAQLAPAEEPEPQPEPQKTQAQAQARAVEARGEGAEPKVKVDVDTPVADVAAAAESLPGPPGTTGEGVQIQAQAEAAAEAELVDSLVVYSPVVGIFRRRPSPDQEPFVEVGDRVREGDILAVVEAMKVLTEVRAAEEGIVEEILVEDGQPVEYGQELMIIRKCGGGAGSSG